MGAHNAKNLVLGPTDLLEEARSEPALPVLAVDNKLRDPVDLSALVVPATGKGVSGEDAIDVDADV